MCTQAKTGRYAFIKTLIPVLYWKTFTQNSLNLPKKAHPRRGETFYQIDEQTRSAALDIKLLPFARGRGIAARALPHAIEAAFNYGAEKVWVDPNPLNQKAIVLYERLGMQRKPMSSELLDRESADALYFELQKSAVV